MTVADSSIGFGEAFLLFLIWIPMIMIWAFALFDIFRRDDLSGGVRALWVVIVILVPFFGTLVYLLFRQPGGTPEERAEIDAASRQFVAKYEGTSPENRLKIISDLHDAGKLTDEEFATQKAKILAS
jgi:hypothetical protein